MKIIMILMLGIAFLGVQDASASPWYARICQKTCGQIDNGPFPTVDVCIRRMKEITTGFECVGSCEGKSSRRCKDIRRYKVSRHNGLATAKLISSVSKTLSKQNSKPKKKSSARR